MPGPILLSFPLTRRPYYGDNYLNARNSLRRLALLGRALLRLEDSAAALFELGEQSALPAGRPDAALSDVMGEAGKNRAGQTCHTPKLRSLAGNVH